MAITRFAFDVFRHILDGIGHRPVSMLSVGYPDSIVSEDALISIFGPRVLDGVTFREDSDKILGLHGFRGLLRRVPDTLSLFRAIGIELTVTDISEIRGGEIICDLNHPVPADLHQRFDIVLDPGTMEHCFNVGQVVQNLLAMAKVKGFVIHLNPLNVMNHGFFNFCPTFYHDFYVDNGHWLAVPLVGFINEGLGYKTFNVDPTKRMPAVPDKSWIGAIVQKLNANSPRWPTQTKYKSVATFSG